ncbi:MAG: Rrf2 family transcriptional regulator [Elusimicrobiota bacterium]
MSRCLSLTRTGEYAISALARLMLMTGGKRGLRVPIRRLSSRQSIPKSFLNKILSRCARAGIIRASRGPAGGVALARSAERISILEIIETCEGPMVRSRCTFFQKRLCRGRKCSVYCPLRRAEEGVRRSLDKLSLASMARSLKKESTRSRRKTRSK